MSDYWINRTLCDVLEEMRKCCKTLNFAPMPGLVEEVQIMGNRMESALENAGDIKDIEEKFHIKRMEYKELDRSIRVLREELKALKDVKGQREVV